MKIDKAEKRDKKRHKRINGMREDGRSNKLIWDIKTSKAEKVKNENPG